MYSWTQPDENNFIPPKVCDYVKEGEELDDEAGKEDPELDEHGHPVDNGYEYDSLGHRAKRQATGELYMDLRQTRCPLLLVADYRFFSEMGGGSSKTTVNYLISLIDR